MTGRGMPVLAPGDEIRLGGRAQRVVALDGTSVRLADVTGAVTVMLTGHLLADPGFELLTGHGRPLPVDLAGGLPGEVRANARWWERHIVEVLTGLPPDAPAGSAPHPDYDPARRSLRQRELAKHAALTGAGHKVGLSTLKRLRRRYELQGLPGLIDQRYARAIQGGPPGGRTDPRVVEETRRRDRDLPRRRLARRAGSAGEFGRAGLPLLRKRVLLTARWAAGIVSVL